MWVLDVHIYESSESYPECDKKITSFKKYFFISVSAEHDYFFLYNQDVKSKKVFIVKKILSVLGLALACTAQSNKVVPCFTPGAYFAVSAGVSNSYNRLSGKGGPDIMNYANVSIPPLLTTPAGMGRVYGLNNIQPSGWSGPGFTILPEFGYTYQVPHSSFTMGVYVNGGVARSGQNAQVPTHVLNTSEVDAPKAMALDGSTYWRVASKGTIGLGATFGFATGANHIYALIGWNNTKYSVGPRGGQVDLNEWPSTDYAATANVKNVSGNVSGVSFGMGYDRQITSRFSIGGRVVVLNSGGSKGIRLPYANYFPNDIDANAPVITVKPFLTTFLVTAKYTFMPKKR